MANVRLADIAAATGLSVSGVSKALANSSEIGEKTRRRVQQTAAAMGYHSNTFARSLRLGSSNLIGVVIPRNDNPFYSGILQGISETLSAYGYTMTVTTSGDTMQGESAALASLLSIPVSGILTVPFALENYQSTVPPVVFMSRYPYRDCDAFAQFHALQPDDNYVVNDDFEGQRLATQHLLAQGFRKIYLFIDAVDPQSLGTYKALMRLNGYRVGCERMGIAYDSRRVFMQIDSPAICYSTARMLCEENPGGGFAICATNDYVAMAALAAIRECGLRVPEQVAVVGYDGIEWGAYYTPQLSTVQLANKEIGVCAAQHLHLRLCGQMDSVQRLTTVLNPSLLKRQST